MAWFEFGFRGTCLSRSFSCVFADADPRGRVGRFGQGERVGDVISLVGGPPSIEANFGRAPVWFANQFQEL